MSRSTKVPAFLRFSGKVIKDWTTASAIGTFLLYLLGYLSLRFHQTALGITTDLAVLDERYLFAGARFLVFVASCLPYAGLLAAAIWGVCHLVWLRLPATRRSALSRAWVVLAVGLALSFAMVLWVMRACFAVIRRPIPFWTAVPGPTWAVGVLRGDEVVQSLFFTGLLLTTAIVTALLAAAIRAGLATERDRTMAAALTAMVLMMILLLPINHGTLLAPYDVQRTGMIGKTAVPNGQKAWVLGEGKDRVSYLLKSDAGTISIVSAPWKLVDRLDMASSESLLDVVFEAKNGGARTGGGGSLLEKVGVIAGLNLTPLGLKGGTENARRGDIWIAGPAETGPDPSPRAKGAYGWPIVQPGTDRIYAMRGEELVRMGLTAGAPEEIARIPNVLRLVGFDALGDRFLALVSRDRDHFDAVFFTAGGQRESTAGEEIAMGSAEADVLLADEHRYGDTSVVADNGQVKLGGQTVDYCQGTKCGQVDYSAHGKRVVYVRSVGGG